MRDPEKKGTHQVLGRDRLICKVVEVTGCSEQELYKNIRGRGGNPARVVAAWWMVEGVGIPHAEVAQRLKMNTIAVYRAIRRVKSDGIRKPYSVIVKWARILEEQWQSQGGIL